MAHAGVEEGVASLIAMPRRLVGALLAKILVRLGRSVAQVPLEDERLPPAIAGHIERLALTHDGRLQLSGWCVDLGETDIADAAQTLLLRVNGRVCATLDRNLRRDDVALAFAGRPQALHPGFELTLSLPEAGVTESGPCLVEIVTQQQPPAFLLRQHVFERGGDSSAQSSQLSAVLSPPSRWATALARRGLAEDDVFYFPIATSGVARGGAAGIRQIYGPYESQTVKVGVRVQILYLRTTLGIQSDYLFDPDFVADKTSGERLVAEDGLNDVIRFAVAEQMPVLFTLNGGIWADAACESVQWCVNDALECDESLCQWNERNQVMPDTALADLPGSMHSPELGRCLSLNIYMEKTRFYKKRNLQSAAALIARFAAEHPQLFIGVSLDADVYVNPFYQGKQWYDYNPQTLRQFRHWLRGDGPYAGQGGAGVPDLSRFRRREPLTLEQVRALAKRRFATWDDVDPPRRFSVWPRQFWCDPWVGLWEQFRRHLVHLHYDELAQWVTEAGLPPDRVYSSQGFMPPGKLIDPLPVRLDSPAKNYDTGGMCIEGSVPAQGRLGVILYGDSALNRIRMEGGASLFAEFRAHSPHWAVVEHNTGDLTRARLLAPYADAYRSLREVAHYGGRFISSMAWNGSPGDVAGQSGFLGYTALRRTPLEHAMQDFMLARADLPRHARLWTFGLAAHADGDGWQLNDAPATPQASGQWALQLDAKGQAILTSPPELGLAVNPDGAHLVLDLNCGSISPAAISIQALAQPEAVSDMPDAAWRALSPECPLAALACDPAGLWLPLAGLPAGAQHSLHRLRLRLRGPEGAALILHALAIYPSLPPFASDMQKAAPKPGLAPIVF